MEIETAAAPVSQYDRDEAANESMTMAANFWFAVRAGPRKTIGRTKFALMLAEAIAADPALRSKIEERLGEIDHGINV
jgi:hypothetical protein